MLTRNRRRAAFTLIELLVVVSIIAVLVALTATAAFGIQNNMRKQNSETTLSKLDQKVRQKVKEIRDQIQNDIPNHRADAEYNSALALTGNNVEGAKAIMLYARLKRQLPMSFAEARQTPLMVGTYDYKPSPAFNGLPASGTNTIEESAACLYAAVAPLGLDGLEQQVGTSPNGYKVFIDGFGQPIGFIRLAYDGNAGELNNSPFTKNAAQDPFDPEGKTATVAALTAQWGVLNCPTLSDAGPYPDASAGYRKANHTIAIFSAGQNKQYRSVTPAIGIFDDGDNLFSYRLREGKHGD